MKLRKGRFFAISMVTVLTLLANLAFPITVFADDETPPAPTEEPALPPIDTPLETTPAVEEQIIVEQTPDPLSEGEGQTVAEVIEQLPEDTQFVVLDELGETVPLVSEEAVEILEEGDPVWCPGLYGEPGATLPGGVGCTPVRTNFTGPAANGLINYINNNEPTYSGAGTIYVFTSLSSLDTTNGNIFLNPTLLNTLTDLTIQGGWNGLTGGSFALSGQSNFGSTRLQVGASGNTWNGNVTINDISFSDVSSGNSLTVFTSSGDVTLNNVDVNNQAGNFSAAVLNSTSGDITVDNSTFDGNDSVNNKGFYADTGGNITITDTTFSDTFNSIDNRNGATLTGSTVELDNVQATNNDFNGIKINATSDVTLNDVTASSNGADGVKIEATGGDVLVENSYFDNNSNNGLGITTDSGYIELNNNYSYENAWNGANLVSAGDVTFNGGSYDTNDRRGILLEVEGGDVELNDVQLSGNEFAGVYAEILSENDFTLNHIITEYNGNYGAYIDTLGDVFVLGGSEFKNNDAAGLFIEQTDDLTINDDATYGGSLFSENGGHGLRAEYVDGDVYIENGTFTLNDLRGLSLPAVAGSIDIISSDFLENEGGGAYLDNSCGCTLGDITIDSSNFNGNGWTGLEAYSAGDINLNSVNANDNDYDGAFFDTTYGTGSIIATGTNGFNNNDEAGLVIEAGGNVTLNNVTASHNSSNGAWVDNTSGAGDVSIYDSTFDYNVEYDFEAGLNVDSNGFVTLSNISASNNGGDGVDIGYEAYTADPSYPGWSGVLIENSVFNDNLGVFGGWGYGLYLEYGNGNVIIDNITASGNLNNGMFIGTSGNVTINTSTFTNTGNNNGVYLEIEGNADICNTTFSGNNEYGLHAEFVDGNLTLNDNTFAGNGSGDYSYGDSGTLTITNGGGCNPAPDGGEGAAEGSRENDGSQSSQASATGNGGKIMCDQTQTTRTVRLFNGDFVTLPCPINEYALVYSTLQTDLPAPVEGNFEFTSALTARVMRNGQSIESLNEPMLVSFLIPTGKDAKDLTILFWDGTELQDFGGTVSADGLYFEISTMQLGTFVLIRK